MDRKPIALNLAMHVKPLILPNFVLIQVGEESVSLSITELSQHALDVLADEFMEALYMQAGKPRPDRFTIAKEE